MFKVKCNQLWENLITTDKPNVRFCINCSRHVFEVKNEIELNKRKHLQQCIFFKPELTAEIAEGICVVAADIEFDDDLGLPYFETKEDKSDNLFPYKKD